MSSSQAPSTVPAASSTLAAVTNTGLSDTNPATEAPATGNAKQMSTPWALGPPIRVGDVGFLCDDVFCRLFNAALPADDPAQLALGVPKGFEPLHVPLEVIEVHENLPEQTAGVQHWLGAEPITPAMYNVNIGPICVLAQALSEDSSVPRSAAEAVDKKDVNIAIRVYIRAHIGSWLEFAHSLNVGISPREIILIRGCFRPPPPSALAGGVPVPVPAAGPAFVNHNNAGSGPAAQAAQASVSSGGVSHESPSVSASKSRGNVDPDEDDADTPGSERDELDMDEDADVDVPDQPSLPPITAATNVRHTDTQFRPSGPSAPMPHFQSPPPSFQLQHHRPRPPPTTSSTSDADVRKAIVTSLPIALASARRRTHAASYICELCGTGLTTKRNLDGHMNAHRGVRAFGCAFCEESFTRTWDRTRHEKRMHPGQVPGADREREEHPHDINVAGSSFEDAAARLPLPRIPNPDSRSVPSEDSISTRAAQAPARPLSGPPIVSSPSIALASSPLIRAKTPPDLPVAGPSTPGPSTLTISSFPTSPTVPKPVVTTAPVALASARRRTRAARFICELCGRALTTRTNLAGHMAAHLGRKEYKCAVCEERFAREWDRKRHERRTHGEGSGSRGGEGGVAGDMGAGDEKMEDEVREDERAEMAGPSERL